MFVNKEHQLTWMVSGGAKELNALMPEAARARGGHIAGRIAANSGRLRKAAEKGGAKSREIARTFHGVQ